MAETPIAPPGQGPVVTFGYCRRCRAELNRLNWGGELPIIDSFNGNWVCRSCWESPNRMEIVKP